MPGNARRAARSSDIAQKDWDAVDIPEQSAADFAKMQPAREALPKRIKRAIGQRGPGRKTAKQPVTLRLDPDVIERFKATGPGWQTRMHTILKKHAPRAATKKSGAKKTGGVTPARKRAKKGAAGSAAAPGAKKRKAGAKR